MFMKLGRDEVLLARHMHKNVLAQWRIQGEGGGGSLLLKTSSDRKATATNRIHTNDLEARHKVMLFLVPFCSLIFDTTLESS